MPQLTKQTNFYKDTNYMCIKIQITIYYNSIIINLILKRKCNALRFEVRLSFHHNKTKFL